MSISDKKGRSKKMVKESNIDESKNMIINERKIT